MIPSWLLNFIVDLKFWTSGEMPDPTDKNCFLTHHEHRAYSKALKAEGKTLLSSKKEATEEQQQQASGDESTKQINEKRMPPPPVTTSEGEARKNFVVTKTAKSKKSKSKRKYVNVFFHFTCLKVHWAAVNMETCVEKTSWRIDDC